MAPGGCPFNAGGVSEDVLKERNSHATTSARKSPVGYNRLRILYEQYVHLPQLRAVWDSPVTQSPVLEPCFAAGMHGIELCFLLLAEFVADGRTYVAKRPRIERVSDDITEQCRLLTEVIDGELEEDDTTASRLSLTQAFPFPGAPPVSQSPGYSPGLARFEAAVRAAFPSMSLPERNSLIKVITNLTSIAFAHFQRWSVGLGIEPQLNTLRAAVGLPPLHFPNHHTSWLDYDALVRPGVVERTLTMEHYTHHEDFFFRSVHLGTECWARIALARLHSASEKVHAGEWHVAAARIGQASKILHYLGTHVLLLTSMNLRDYLLLKVELEGTSGEGSIQVKSMRPASKALLTPLVDALLNKTAGGSRPKEGLTLSTNDSETAALGLALMEVYEKPDQHREHYNYAKALEDLESGLLGGFYYQHFCLAANVIGSDARGTMHRAVQGLKTTYETPLFPVLDRVRSGLGVKVDAELAHVKGRMMDDIIDAYLRGEQTPRVTEARTAATSAGCPFGGGGGGGGLPIARAHPALHREEEKEVVHKENDQNGALPVPEIATESAAASAALMELYGWKSVPREMRVEIEAGVQRFARSLDLVGHSRGSCGAGGPLAFLDHAWGQVSPRALHAAVKNLTALYLLGNPSWDHLFARLMPNCADHIRHILGISLVHPTGSESEEGNVMIDVHFGHNSHELVTRMLSQHLLERKNAGPLRILTSGSEFYSITRQLNRLVECDAVDVRAEPAEPATTFAQRCIAAARVATDSGQPFDVIYVSQVTYLRQETLLEDVPAFVEALVGLHKESTGLGLLPLIIIDGYHAFCALPRPALLGTTAQHCCYLGGLIKHAGCGANTAFITVPRTMAPRPAFTGWLADPALLQSQTAPNNNQLVGWQPGLELQGGTPSLFLPLLIFEETVKLWKESIPAVDVALVHIHVTALQDSLVHNLPKTGESGLTQETLIPLATSKEHRSHTLVFEQPGAEEAKAVVAKLAAQGIMVDCRGQHVRVGIGANHNAEDICALLRAMRAD